MRATENNFVMKGYVLPKVCELEIFPDIPVATCVQM